MKKLDKNLKIGIIALAIFVVFQIGFSALISLVQSGSIPDFAASQRVQGLLSFVMFLPLCIAMLFAGKHFKSTGSNVGGVLTFVSITLLVFGILQALLSLLGAYGA